MLARTSPPRVLVIGAMIIAIGFLAFGVLRIFAGGAILGMDMGWWSLGGDFASGLTDARAFMAEHEAQALVPWSVRFYFALILAMGVILSAGAALYLAGKRSAGLKWIAAYLALHGGMFVNYQLINPKIALWGLTVVLWAVLWWRHRAG